LPAVDGRGLVLGNLQDVAIAALRQRTGRCSKGGTGEQQAAAGDRERHADEACYAGGQEETR
jgi:hypothetical protein